MEINSLYANLYLLRQKLMQFSSFFTACYNGIFYHIFTRSEMESE